MSLNSCEIVILGSNEDTLFDLQEWLREEGIQASPKANPPMNDEMGGGIAETLQVFFESAAVAGVIQCVFLYIQRRRPYIKILIKRNGVEFYCDINDTPNVDQTGQKVLEITKAFK